MIVEIIKAGLLALKDYIATYVLTCLVPAFLLVGGIVSFIDCQAILLYLGNKDK